MKLDKKSTKLTVVVYFILLGLLFCTLFFYSKIEEFLKLKPNLSEINSNALEVHFVDVGQGDAILIRFPDKKTMIVDSGLSKKENYLISYIDNVFFNKGEKRKFNFAMLTHPDSDHAGNMLSVLEKYQIDVFYRPNIYVEALEDIDGKVNYHNTITYSNVISKLIELEKNEKTEIIIPTINNYNMLNNYRYMHIFPSVMEYYSDSNCYSPFVILNHNNAKIMLTGDATSKNELEAINNYNNELLDIDVVKLGHHGSATSTSSDFLNVTTPAYAIVSVGANNSHNHPSPETLSRIANYNLNNNSHIQVMQTQHLGNIICYVNNNGDINFLNIHNIDNYLFIDYYIIFGGVVIVISFMFFYPKISKGLKQAKNKKL